MICSNCGFNNVESAKFCGKCGHSLNYTNLRQANNYSQNNARPKNNNNILIISITLIVIILIIAGTFLYLNNGNIGILSDNGNDQTSVVKDLKVNTASFYLDGNPNTGITTTMHVGKEHAGESMGVMTTFSRDGVNINHPSEYEYCTVDDDGDIVFTDYTPIPKYPDYCMIEISYNDQIFRFGCDMGKYKGLQTSVPQIIS